MKKSILLITISLSQTIFAQITHSPDDSAITKSPVKGDISKVYDYPDQMPRFSKGILGFRDEFQKAIDVSAVETGNNENILKGQVSFIVERDGSISNIVATGKNPAFNTSVIKAIGSINGKWDPAIHKGEIVRSRFVLPLTVQKNK
ncbi:hypothetical protein [uncultured Chryseobacterium sp.]|uniref:energy transducer TonB n=1 Tax=uncultured Chryseobacterium sp. TaxID=259322 RepID=UPI0025DF3B5C|nr:hypothetical protein [uncultured Chryseobacterium sp.]